MLLVGNLGFQSLILVTCLVFPAVVVAVVRRKWRLGMARKEEIKRLLAMASEEAARVEIEASFDFGYTVAPISRNHHLCAVCHSPTSTRCSRCKTVRYCSGKCQIIHWRQGHKEECHPPSTSDWALEKESKSWHKLASQHHDGSFDKKFSTEVEEHIEPVRTLYDGLALPNSSCSTDGPTGTDIIPNLHADREQKSTSEVPVTSFSEFCIPNISRELSDGVSASESSSQSGSPRSDSDGYLSAETSFDMRSAKTGVSIVDPSKPFHTVVNSRDKFSQLKTENDSKSIGIDPDFEKPSSASVATSIPGSYEGSTNESCYAFSGFQERNGSSNGSKNRSLGSRSFKKFSFSSSGETFLYNENAADGNYSAASSSGGSKTMESTLLVGTNDVALKVKTSPSSCKGIQNTDNTTKELSGFHAVKSLSSPSHIDPFPVFRSESGSIHDLESERSCPPVSNDSSNTSNKSEAKARSTQTLSVDDSSANLLSINGRVSVPPTHSRKVGNIQVSVGVSSLDANVSSNGFRPFVQNELQRSKLDHKSVVSGRGVAERHSNKGNLSYDLFVNLYNWNKLELQPSGLVNCGNSCYANVVLQCLAFTPPLTAYFLQGLHSKACAKPGWCFTCEFESLLLKVKEGKSPLSPSGIISQLRKIGSQLVNGKEEDAHEFLRCAIDTMQSISFKEAQASQSGTVEVETTLIGLTFGGYLLSKIKCTRCESKSERIERMLDLTVEISGDIETMEEALQQYTCTETLDGDNKYQCSRCKSYVKAKKKLTILEAPNILTIALKRFQSGKFGKLNKPVVFSEILDLAPFMSGRSDKSPVYRLYGVIVHLDVMNAAFSGHYVCYVRNNQNKWFKIDDSSVTAMDFGNVPTRGAYMLFYARCSPRAPRLIRSKITTTDPSCINGKSNSFKSDANSTSPDSQNFRGKNSSSDPANISSFYKKFRQLQKILEEDSTSDSSSLFSSNSDEGSCSTNSTSDSMSTADDLSDFIYGDSWYGWNGSQHHSDVDSSLSLSHLANSSRCAGNGARTSGAQPGDLKYTNGISNNNLANRSNW